MFTEESKMNNSQELTTTMATANTTSEQSEQNSTFVRVLIGLGCTIVILLSLLGNLLVVTVICRFKRLKNATNYILLSLAIADITVALLVMIPATIQDLQQRWVFGQLFCKFYASFDIACCTASILHLLLVAIDRYIAIFKPLTYRNIFRTWHVFTAVVFVWILSFCISFIPIFMGWNRRSDDDHTGPPAPDTHDSVDICFIEANIPYAIISSSLSFYIPFVLMTVVYIQIYIVAKRQAKAIAHLDVHTRNLSHDSQNLNSNSTNNLANGRNLSVGENECKSVLEERANLNKDKSKFLKMISNMKKKERKKTKDTKAIKTLGIIMGIFIAMWFPFFYMYLSVPITNKPYPVLIERLITWIGYVNSFINPIIYALTNKDFRKAYVTTFRALSQRLCPESFQNSRFARSDHDYFTSSMTTYKVNNVNAANQQRQTKRKALANLICCLKCIKHESGSSPSAQLNSRAKQNSSTINKPTNHINRNDKETSPTRQKNTTASNEAAADTKQENCCNGQLASSIRNENENNNNNLVPPMMINSDKILQAFAENVNEFDYIDYDVMSRDLSNGGGGSSIAGESISSPLNQRLATKVAGKNGIKASEFELQPLNNSAIS